MIDAEVDVFDSVYKAVQFLFPEGCFTSEYTPSPPALPHACLKEEDNYTDDNLQDSSGNERFANLMYTANVYAEDKFQCRKLMNAIDTKMQALGFRRMSLRPVDNAADTSIYRIVAQWRGKVNQDKTIFRF